MSGSPGDVSASVKSADLLPLTRGKVTWPRCLMYGGLFPLSFPRLTGQYSVDPQITLPYAWSATSCTAVGHSTMRIPVSLEKSTLSRRCKEMRITITNLRTLTQCLPTLNDSHVPHHQPCGNSVQKDHTESKSDHLLSEERRTIEKRCR